MQRFNLIDKKRVADLPQNSGVYTFKNNEGLLYIGKATNIRSRVKNHFSQPTHRDNLFVGKAKTIGYLQTFSEIEALILEAQLIKKYQPRFNVIWRDDKKYFYVAISGCLTPAVSITHQPITTSKCSEHIGPFTDGRALKKTLQLLRRVFPYYTQANHPDKMCAYCHLNLCPGPNPDLKKYKKTIKYLIAVLLGKKQKVLKDLRKEMQNLSKQKRFEEAGKTRDKLFALEKIISNARIFEKQNTITVDWKKTKEFLQDLLKTKKSIRRIEGYDVSNIQGKEATASMVVFINGQPDRNEYRKFKIQIAGKPNDFAMLQEVLDRRMSHNEWQSPDLIFVDGGKPQISAALSIIKNKIPIIALAKKNNELYLGNNKKPFLLKSLPREIFNLILQIRDESHRFAIVYHKKLREKELFAFKP